MDTTKAEELTQRYLDGKCTIQESAMLETWYNQQSELKSDRHFDVDFDALSEGLSAPVPLDSQHVKSLQKTSSIRFYYLTAAAVAVIALCVYFFRSTEKERSKVVSTISSDIGPGRTGATLTLADGQKIYISDSHSGKLVDAGGVSISKLAGGQILYELKGSGTGRGEMNTLQTGNGEQIQLILPDKSKVFLNAASSIKYPSSFTNLKERAIELSGEAYFEVSKDQMHPFIVSCKGQRVVVLGTHFNISGYADEHIVKTTLLEGSVKINEKYLLDPGQQALYDGLDVQLKKVNVHRETAWVDNDFYFDEEPTGAVMQDLARWYNISVTYSDEQLKQILLNGQISRDKNLSTVLERIGKAAKLRFTVHEHSVHVEKSEH